MKKSRIKGLMPKQLYVERCDVDRIDYYTASPNPVDFVDKDRDVEVGVYELVRTVKLHQCVKVEDVE